LVLYFAWRGGWFLFALCAFVSIAGVREMAGMLGCRGIHVWEPAAQTLGIACVWAAAYGPEWLWNGFPLMAVFLGLVMPVAGRRWFSIPDGVATQAALLYAPYLIAHLQLLWRMPGGERLVVLAILATWATDTAAYFGGVWAGRHKLCPSISPAKTIEGALFGAGAGMLTGGGVAAWAGLARAQGLLIGLAAAVMAQTGDLAESAIKRYTGVKDSGKLIPGHGGVLDRFDSLLFSGPMVYWVVFFLFRRTGV